MIAEDDVKFTAKGAFDYFKKMSPMIMNYISEEFIMGK